MGSFEKITFDIKDAVAVITVNDSKLMNAFNEPMCLSLMAQLFSDKKFLNSEIYAR
jgi:enoyl-CoA hydratase/carnithine racemase